MALSAPSVICLKSEFNKKYLRFQQDRNSGKYALLESTADTAVDPYAQFEVVKATKAEGVFHLKCRFSNKFLVRWLPDRYWISASADRPNEDENSWNCTLFKPILVEDGETKKIQLQHVQLEYNLIIWTTPNFNSYLLVGNSSENEPNKRDIFTVVDWKSLFDLPKRVAIKAPYNNKYLGIVMIGGNRPHLQFSFTNPKDPKVEHEIFQYKDGIICLKSTFNGKYWMYYKNDSLIRIFAEGEEDPRLTNKYDALFQTNVLDVNSISLYNMDNYYYCRSQSGGVANDIMRVNIADVNIHAKFEFVDLDKLP